MKNGKCILSTGTAVQTLGLSLIVGGILALGAFVAPELFRNIDRHSAGQAMSAIFYRYDKVLLAGLVMVLLGELMRFVSGVMSHKSVISLGRYAALGLMSVLMFYSIFVLTPDLYARAQAGVPAKDTPGAQEFTRKHKQSENLYKLELLGGILLVILTPFVPLRSEDGAAACCPGGGNEEPAGADEGAA